MKQLLILSGKGGTGKTTIASAFIKFGKIRGFADCDVDAPNLHLVMDRLKEPELSDYYGMNKAHIDEELCTSCDLCREHCKFDAIDIIDGNYRVNEYACEGCSVCQVLCPVDAITMKRSKAGELKLYADEDIFSTAELKMGSGNSGLLVTDVKKALKEKAENLDFVLIDGSPGIGCPVIASISGVDMVLIVAEPSISGINDMERIVATSKKFGVKIAVCVNKYDTNIQITSDIKSYCKTNNIDYIGEIPFDQQAVKLLNRGLSIADEECASGRAAKVLFEKTMTILKK